MSTTKDQDQITTETKPLKPNSSEPKKSELPQRGIPDFPGDNSGSGTPVKPTGQ